MRKYLLTTVLAVGGMTFAAGDAWASLQIVNGTAGSIPGVSSNEALGQNGIPGAPLAGFFDGSVRATAAGQVVYTVLGYEANATNTFNYGAATLFSGGGGTNFGFSTSSGPVAVAMNEVLDFEFLTTAIMGGQVTNAQNSTRSENQVNFFASTGGAGDTGNVVFLFLDDTGGAGDDDNHDDLVVRVSFTPVTVPEPASLALFGAGLLGLGLARRRKSA